MASSKDKKDLYFMASPLSMEFVIDINGGGEGGRCKLLYSSSTQAGNTYLVPVRGAEMEELTPCSEVVFF